MRRCFGTSPLLNSIWERTYPLTSGALSVTAFLLIRHIKTKRHNKLSPSSLVINNDSFSHFFPSSSRETANMSFCPLVQSFIPLTLRVPFFYSTSSSSSCFFTLIGRLKKESALPNQPDSSSFSTWWEPRLMPLRHIVPRDKGLRPTCCLNFFTLSFSFAHTNISSLAGIVVFTHPLHNSQHFLENFHCLQSLNLIRLFSKRKRALEMLPQDSLSSKFLTILLTSVPHLPITLSTA